MAKHIELTKYKRRPDFYSWIIVVSHVALVLSPVYFAAYLGPSRWWLALWLSYGFLMNGLLNLMHECAHYHVFVPRSGSDFIGRWVLGPLALADFDGYRERHWKHHTHFGIDGDTKDAYLEDIRGIRLVTFFLRCLTLQEALRKLRHQTSDCDDKLKGSGKTHAWIARTAMFQGLFLVSMLVPAGMAAGRSWPGTLLVALLTYGVVYGYGLASLTVFAATLRAVAEHQLEAGAPSTPRRGTLRNFKCGPIGWLVLGAYGFAEHGTHHCEPGLPYYHLPQATVEVAEEDPELAPVHGYLGVLATLATPSSRYASVGTQR